MKSRFIRELFYYSILWLINYQPLLYSYEIYKETDRTSYVWKRESVPVKTNLKSIHSDAFGNVYISSRFILKLTNGEWNLLNPQPPHLANDIISPSGSSSMWSTTVKYSNESELFYFNGKEWQFVNTPFANQITSMYFPDERTSYGENGTGWIGGDREIAFFNKKKWELISYPSIFGAAFAIGGTSKNNFWIHTSDSKVYHYVNGKWQRELPDSKVNLFKYVNQKKIIAITKNTLYEYDGNSWRKHSSSLLLQNQNSLCYISENNVWTVGQNGTIRHYNGEVWYAVNSPTENDLNDILILSTGEGWITGNNGTLLRYSPEPQSEKINSSIFFNQLKVSSLSKELNDEYGVAMEDFNGDGQMDIYAVCIFEPNRLYINRSQEQTTGSNISNLIFVDEAYDRNITGLIQKEKNASALLYLGIGAADVDNDGDKDLYLCSLSGENLLLLNDGDGFFKDVSKENGRGVGKKERTNAAIFGDVDNDSDLDLFITNEESTNRLFLNDGKGFFTEITESAGLSTAGGGMGASFADIDNDNDLDICVATWSTTNLLYRNDSKNGVVKFVDISDQAGIKGFSYAKSNGVAFADVDNDGDLDLFISNRKTSNRFYINDGKGNFNDKTYEYFGIDSMLSYGISFADFDNDGYQDLYVANVGENVVYKNLNGKKFINSTSDWGMQLSGYSTGTSSGDIDGDGDIDLYVANYIDEESKFYLNNINDKNFISINIKGTKSNRDGVGTKLWLYKAGGNYNKESILGYREINSGSGYCSHNSLTVHFGVKPSGNYDVVLFFPASGIRKVIKNLSAGAMLDVSEEEDPASFFTLTQKSLLNFLTHPYTHIETVKFIIVLVFIFTSYSHFRKKKIKWSFAAYSFLYSSLIIFYWLQVVWFSEMQFMFSTFLPISSIFFLLFIIHLIYERIIIATALRIEKENTRNKIARDLHDDLASTLSSSYIYNEALRNSLKKSDPNQKELAGKVSSLISDASDAVTDIIWSLSTRHDKLDQLLMRLKVLVAETCRLKSIQHDVISSVDDDTKVMNENIRRNIYLIFKETVNNIIKHSNASSVRLQITLSKNLLDISLADNGEGIPGLNRTITSNDTIDDLKISSDMLHGNGIKNIMTRAREIGALIKIESCRTTGTLVHLHLKLS